MCVCVCVRVMLGVATPYAACAFLPQATGDASSQSGDLFAAPPANRPCPLPIASPAVQALLQRALERHLAVPSSSASSAAQQLATRLLSAVLALSSSARRVLEVAYASPSPEHPPATVRSLLGLMTTAFAAVAGNTATHTSGEGEGGVNTPPSAGVPLVTSTVVACLHIAVQQPRIMQAARGRCGTPTPGASSDTTALNVAVLEWIVDMTSVAGMAQWLSHIGTTGPVASPWHRVVTACAHGLLRRSAATRGRVLTSAARVVARAARHLCKPQQAQELLAALLRRHVPVPVRGGGGEAGPSVPPPAWLVDVVCGLLDTPGMRVQTMDVRALLLLATRSITTFASSSHDQRRAGDSELAALRRTTLRLVPRCFALAGVDQADADAAAAAAAAPLIDAGVLPEAAALAVACADVVVQPGMTAEDVTSVMTAAQASVAHVATAAGGAHAAQATVAAVVLAALRELLEAAGSPTKEGEASADDLIAQLVKVMGKAKHVAAVQRHLSAATTLLFDAGRDDSSGSDGDTTTHTPAPGVARLLLLLPALVSVPGLAPVLDGASAVLLHLLLAAPSSARVLQSAGYRRVCDCAWALLQRGWKTAEPSSDVISTVARWAKSWLRTSRRQMDNAWVAAGDEASAVAAVRSYLWSDTHTRVLTCVLAHASRAGATQSRRGGRAKKAAALASLDMQVAVGALAQLPCFWATATTGSPTSVPAPAPAPAPAPGAAAVSTKARLTTLALGCLRRMTDVTTWSEELCDAAQAALTPLVQACSREDTDEQPCVAQLCHVLVTRGFLPTASAEAEGDTMMGDYDMDTESKGAEAGNRGVHQAFNDVLGVCVTVSRGDCSAQTARLALLLALASAARKACCTRPALRSLLCSYGASMSSADRLRMKLLAEFEEAGACVPGAGCWVLGVREPVSLRRMLARVPGLAELPRRADQE